MKLITDNLISSTGWGSKATVSSTDSTSAYSASYIREWLNQEFLPNLYNYQNIIVTNYSNVDYKWNATTTTAPPSNKISDTTKNEDFVGLLNSYEYYNTGYRTLGSYDNSYLNIGYNWWLLTPYNNLYVNYVKNDGNISTILYTTFLGIRPVINLLSSVIFESGDGSINNPYRIKGDKKIDEINGTFLNTRTVGEYVKIEGDTDANRIFRIVDKEVINENLTTKLVLADFVRDIDTNEILIKKFGTSCLWGNVSETDETSWKGYLNNTWLKQLDSSYNPEIGTSNILEKGTYYLGYESNFTGNYKTMVCNDYYSNMSVKDCIANNLTVENDWNGKGKWIGYVGTLRIGEMFAAQILKYDDLNTASYWLLNMSKSGYTRYASLDGTLMANPVSYQHAIRPTIHLKSTLVIKSGNGTKDQPFLVGL